MSNQAKTKGKTFETKVADFLHGTFYVNNSQYKDLFDSVGHNQIKPRRDSSSGTFKTSTSDIELGLLKNFFPYSVECKDWKTLDISIDAIAKGKIKVIVDIFEKQCKPVAEKSNLIPVVVFKANRTGWFLFTEEEKDLDFKVKCLYNGISYYFYLFMEFVEFLSKKKC